MHAGLATQLRRWLFTEFQFSRYNIYELHLYRKHDPMNFFIMGAKKFYIDSKGVFDWYYIKNNVIFRGLRKM